VAGLSHHNSNCIAAPTSRNATLGQPRDLAPRVPWLAARLLLEDPIAIGHYCPMPATRSATLQQLTRRAMEIRGRFAAFERKKFRREWTKEEIMQGFVVDVGDLMKLVMAKSGVRRVEDVDQKLAHELSDCLWSVLVLAKLYGIDLEREFGKTMDELAGA